MERLTIEDVLYKQDELNRIRKEFESELLDRVRMQIAEARELIRVKEVSSEKRIEILFLIDQLNVLIIELGQYKNCNAVRMVGTIDENGNYKNLMSYKKCIETLEALTQRLVNLM